MRTVQLTEDQGKKLKVLIDRKQAYHDAIRKYGPNSAEAIKARDLLINKK